MPYDVELVAIVRALSTVQARCVNKRLYHQSVLQSDPGVINFPAIVYAMQSNTPFMEIDRKVACRTAEFTFDCYSANADDVRAISEEIQSIEPMAHEDVFDWLEAHDTTDGYEPPIDLDASGLKFAQVTVTIVYRG